MGTTKGSHRLQIAHKKEINRKTGTIQPIGDYFFISASDNLNGYTCLSVFKSDSVN